MLPRKGVLSNLIGLLALIMLLSGLAIGQTVKVTSDEKPIEPVNATKPGSSVISEPAANPKEAKPSESPQATEPAKAEAKVNPPAEAEPAAEPQATPAQCKRMITASVVAMPQPIMLNRLGATIPDGLIFALKRDTVQNGNQIQLRAGKRPRPLVLRANVGDCMTITFTNAIPSANFTGAQKPFAKIGTTEVSLHIQGMEWVVGPGDDGSFVGKNHSSLASVSPVPPNMPPNTQTYTLYAKAEGTYLLYTMGDTTSQGVQLTRGLFGALNVQPAGAEWYRSQVTATDLNNATYNANNLGGNTLTCPPNSNNCTFTATGKPAVPVIKTPSGALNTTDNHPVINYNAVDGTGTPILKMLNESGNIKEIIYSDLTAIITGPNAGRFPGTTGVNNPEPPCNAENNPNLPGGTVDPDFCVNPASPDRKQPYREITTIYHGGLIPVVTQAFPVFTDANMSAVLEAGDDAFAINYGSGGIGAEVYANRIGVGPMGDCIDCKFEEFFLSAWSVADPAMLVDKPANSGMQAPCNNTGAFNSTPCGGTRTPSSGFPYTMTPTKKATAAFFPDDPSNVFHSYINDHVKFRILHGGRDVTHVHHQHAHQWLQSPNSDESSYLDSQMISPGASYTLEMTYNGSGNRNKVVGDSIFHCHFYPHFAAGMWAMWRTHDTFEAGTYVLSDGKVVPGSRALPDGEIDAGTPTPAIVPMPTLPMAPLPAYAQIQHNVKVHDQLIPHGGQVVIGGTCAGNKINGLDVIGGCTDGQQLNGTVINSAFNGTTMTGQFQKSNNNQLQNPGFPYYIPGIAGARAPHPPLDFAPDGANFMDGGLPRHVSFGGSVAYESHDQFDWSKDLETLNAVRLPENGTDVENAAINFFKVRCHQTTLPDGSPANCGGPTPFGFIVNGLPLGPVPGAPFADPAVDDKGNAVGTKRVYQAAAFQLDVAFNTKRWHFPQQRMLSLWKDVQPTLNFNPVNAPAGSRPPEPLFFRGNTGDIIEYWHTNLVPNYYNVDDFQVRTPTDIIGQHIHLVKFDVTSSDGAGNGFNYEDGTFSPGDVQDQIHAINNAGGLKQIGGAPQTLTPKPPPADIFNCSANPNDARCKPCPTNLTATFRPVCQSWLGAQTTIQRWYIDPLVDDSGVDRTMRTVFTHDHFGPSTHQQAGLYAGLLIEPSGASWRDPETGNIMGRPANQPPIRSDGGPTSWKVDVLTTNAQNQNVSYREFMLEFQDLQLAYAWATVAGTSGPKLKEDPNPKKGWTDPAYAINAPGGTSTSAPNLISTGMAFAPPGTQTVNYRNDPIAWRVGIGNDMSYAFDSALKQASNAPPNGDPFTPLMRAYQGDNVQIRTLVGAHVFAHQFDFAGPTWFAEPSWKNSGYRSAQAMGLSEHFEFLFNVPSSSAPNTARKCPDGMSQKNCVDYFYSPSMDEFGISNGMWGLFRSYDPTQLATKLVALPNNAIGPSAKIGYQTCPNNPTTKTFNITAVTALGALGGEIPFNSRGAGIKSTSGVMYVRTEDLDAQGKLLKGVPIEPLILRANAGDCIVINLTNKIPPTAEVFNQKMFMAPPFAGVNPVNGQPVFKSQMSKVVGLHPQLLGYDPASSQGMNIGWNRQGRPDQLAAFNSTVKYQWYAGRIERDATGTIQHIPVEFGSLNLFPSDLMYQQPNGLFGAMIIEPANTATITCDGPSGPTSCDPNPSASPTPVPPTTRASATVTLADSSTYREFVTMFSDNLRVAGSSQAVNYRTEPQGFRYTGFSTSDFSCMTSNQLVNGDPQTPIYTADAGQKVRFRLLHTFGTGTSQVFSLHGHAWQRNPYNNNSTQLGDQKLSQWLGSRDNYGSTDHADILLSKAGGEGGRPGDYLYTAFVPVQGSQGPWGIFRVGGGGAGGGGTDGVGPINGACPQTPVQPSQATPTPKQPDIERFLRRPLNSTPRP